MNEVDARWERYLLSRDVNHYREVIACASFDLINASSYFGELYSSFRDFYFNFFCRGQKVDSEFFQKINLLSNTKKSLLGEFLTKDLTITELCYSDLSSQDIESLTSDGIEINQLEEFVKIFEESSSSKLELMISNGLPSFFKEAEFFSLIGTFVFDGCFIGAQAGQHLIFILSVQSPIDAIFFPKTGLLVKSKDLKYEVVSRATKLVKAISRNIPVYEQWQSKSAASNFVNLIRDKRPYHVIADEISGNHFLHLLLPGKFSTAFLERASFVESDAFDGKVIPNESLQEYAVNKVVFSSYHRVGEDDFYESYRDYLIRLAEDRYRDDLECIDNKNAVFWIGIAGGEKRAWLEEIEGLEKVIKLLQEKFDDCKFVFDGWTINHKPTESDYRNIASHEALMHKLVSRCKIYEGSYINLIGTQILKKIAFANKCSFFVSCAGTPAFWPSKVCKVPGFVHNSKQMINRVDNTMNMSNVSKVPLEDITDRTEGMLVNRWDYVSYSIEPEAFRTGFTEALSKYIEFR